MRHETGLPPGAVGRYFCTARSHAYLRFLLLLLLLLLETHSALDIVSIDPRVARESQGKPAPDTGPALLNLPAAFAACWRRAVPDGPETLCVGPRLSAQTPKERREWLAASGAAVGNGQLDRRSRAAPCGKGGTSMVAAADGSLTGQTPGGDTLRVREVWQDNLAQEMKVSRGGGEA